MQKLSYNVRYVDLSLDKLNNKIKLFILNKRVKCIDFVRS